MKTFIAIYECMNFLFLTFYFSFSIFDFLYLIFYFWFSTFNFLFLIFNFLLLIFYFLFLYSTFDFLFLIFNFLFSIFYFQFFIFNFLFSIFYFQFFIFNFFFLDSLCLIWKYLWSSRMIFTVNHSFLRPSLLFHAVLFPSLSSLFFFPFLIALECEHDEATPSLLVKNLPLDVQVRRKDEN